MTCSTPLVRVINCQFARPSMSGVKLSFLSLSSDRTSKAVTCPLFTELCSMMLNIRKVCQKRAALQLEPTVSFKWNATTPSERNTSGLCHYFVHLSFLSSAFQCKHSLFKFIWEYSTTIWSTFLWKLRYLIALSYGHIEAIFPYIR